MISRIRNRLAHALDRRFETLHHRLEDLATRVDVLAAQIDEEISPALRIMAGSDAEAAAAARGRPTGSRVRAAFEEPEPLVTVILPTHLRAELLSSRSLPAILGQTYGRLEILVVADAHDADAEIAVREANDPRVRYLSLTQRYVYPDPHRHWLAASTLARNEGYRLASGRWLFDFDDDDSLPEDAIAILLQTARDQRLEAVQGIIRQRLPDGATTDLVPAAPDRLPLKGAVVHAHLRFFTPSTSPRLSVSRATGSEASGWCAQACGSRSSPA